MEQSINMAHLHLGRRTLHCIVMNDYKPRNNSQLTIQVEPLPKIKHHGMVTLFFTNQIWPSLAHLKKLHIPQEKVNTIHVITSLPPLARCTNKILA